ncbi:MAG: NnrS family protein [Alphaproteobacteria bacterium]|nr:NnrS family protein [Alphaproteobacteria bacterium]
MTQIEADENSRERRYTGPVFFEYGFRPFFLGAGLQAVLAMLAWMVWITLQQLDSGWPDLSIAVPVHQWHAHELIFGYGLAVVAGFFLTAVPSWTGRQPVRGALLAVLFGLWLLARIASWTSAWLPPVAVALPELAFIGLLSYLVARALLSGWSKRNFVFLPVLTLLFVSAALHHLEAMAITGWTSAIGHLLAIDALLVLLTVIGGRVVPAFTTNVLRREGTELLPRAADRRDTVAILMVVALLVADLVAPGTVATGWIAIAAGAAGAVRMVGWRTRHVLTSPILWVLHLGYAWLVLGLLFKGFVLVTGTVSEILALHALTIGALGCMTLGVMTRAGLGHTGRPLHVSTMIAASYLLVSLAAVIRIAWPLADLPFGDAALLASGLLWSAAFLIFTAVYWPVLTRPRVSAAD